jgi:hypothetical protein
LVLFLLAVTAGCGNGSATSSAGVTCNVVAAIHEAGDRIVAAVGSARAGNASGAALEGPEAQRIAEASIAVLDIVPETPDEADFRVAVRVAAANLEEVTFVFVGFVPGEPPSLDDMVTNSPAALVAVDANLRRLDTELTAPIASGDLCRAIVTPARS